MLLSSWAAQFWLCLSWTLEEDALTGTWRLRLGTPCPGLPACPTSVGAGLCSPGLQWGTPPLWGLTGFGLGVMKLRHLGVHTRPLHRGVGSLEKSNVFLFFYKITVMSSREELILTVYLLNSVLSGNCAVWNMVLGSVRHFTTGFWVTVCAVFPFIITAHPPQSRSPSSC